MRTIQAARLARVAWRGCVLVIALASAALVAWPMSAFAAKSAVVQPTGGDGDLRFVYQVEGKPLPEVLQDFAASQDLVAVVAADVSGVVSGKFDTTREKFLKGIAKAYGILWYHDGSAIYFYPGKAIQTKLFRLKGFDRREVQELLESLKLGDRRYPITFNTAQNTLLVSGPPRHIEIIKEALDTLDIGVTEKNERVTRIVPLHFASAGERNFGTVTVRGLADTLRALYGEGTGGRGDGALAGDGNGRGAVPSAAMQKLYGSTVKPMAGLAGERSESTAPRLGTSQRGMESPVRYDGDQPTFEADEATNSIIVQGRLSRMQEYESLIRRLDQKPQLVELEAMIIDVSTDSVGSLGVDWSIANSKGSFSVTSPGNVAPDSPAGSPLNSATYTLGTVLSNAGRELIARVHALQGEGKARILSRPTVLGVANRSAVMKEKRVATVRVAGNLEANLFQIEAGTMLQVTPQVIATEAGNQIKLSLYIEDGSFEAQLVDQVPVVKKTEIRTEAHVREGDSLLIGGIIVDSDIDQNNGVPGLRNLPLVGGLFRWSGNRNTRTERLFLITPRVVESPQLPSLAQAARADLRDRAAKSYGAPAAASPTAVAENGKTRVRDANDQPSLAIPPSPTVRIP